MQMACFARVIPCIDNPQSTDPPVIRHSRRFAGFCGNRRFVRLSVQLELRDRALHFAKP